MALPWLRFEPPQVRQARLRDTTRRLTGEVLEFTERLEGLRRFREAEERQQPRFEPSPSPSGRFVDRVAAPQISPTGTVITGQPVPPDPSPEPLPEQLTTFRERLLESRGGKPAPPSGPAPLINLIKKGVEAGDLAFDEGNAAINRILDTPPEQIPSREEVGIEPVGEIFERGAAISRPAVQAAQPVIAEPFEQVGAAGIPGVSPAAGGVATAIESQIVEDIATELLNPAAILAVAPFAMAGTTTAAGVRLTGRALATQITSNLLATGLEPALVRGTLRGLTVIGTRGVTAARTLPKVVRESDTIQRALKFAQSEAGGRPPTGPRPPGGRARIGEPIKVANLDAVVADLRRVGGVDYELYANASTKPGADGGVVRVVDADSGSVVTIKRFPTFKQAETEYRQALEAAAKAEVPAAAAPRGGEAVTLKLPDELTGGVPPQKPTPPGERGLSGAQQILDIKEETLLRPGPATKIPGIKQAASGLNPSVMTERNILVSYNARQAASAALETEFAAARQVPLDDLRAILRDDPPRYVGPDDNPFKNTLKDWGDNPEHYVLTQQHRAAAAAYDAAGNQTLARSAGEFGVRVDPFPVKDGGFFTPTVATRESLDAAIKKVSEGYTSASVAGKGARTKTRVYEGAYQRWLNNADFRAETDLAELTGLHDRAMATLAGNETFKLGAGGQSRLGLMEQLHPSLFTRMTGLRQRLEALRGTAGRVNQRVGRAIDDFLAGPDSELADLADSLDVTVTRGRFKGMDIKAVNAEIKRVRQEIRKLRPAWEAASLEPYVLNRKTFQFHLPEQSAAIDNILQTKLNIGQGFADIIDEVRLTAFAGDVSPLTIQGLLGGLSHPLTTATNSRNIVRSLWNPDELLKIATKEPALVERFTIATGRPFGEVGPEFVQRFKGVERARIPFTQLRPGHALNRRLMAAVEEIRYAAWKTDQGLLRKLNPGMTQNVADAESANFLSKMIPALNPAETGRSVLRARFERVPVISTSFLASPVALTKDMASGLAKLGAPSKLSPIARWQALSGREQLALLRGLSLAGSLSALTVGSYIASGFTPEEAVRHTLDPTGNNPRFLSIALGKDRFIPIGGPVRSFIRGMMPTEAGKVGGVPIYVPFVNTRKWLLGKGTPAIKAPIDLARNEDFFGGKIATGSFPENILRAVWYGANSVLPLAAAEPSEAIRRGEVEPTDVAELAIRGGGQLAGSDIRELRLREAFERETGRSYAETPSALRRQIIADNPLLQRLAEQQEVFFPDEGKRIRAERSAELLPHAQAFLRGGVEAARAYSDNRKFIMAKFGGISEEVFGDLDIEPKGRDNELLAEYYEVDFRADHNGNGIPGDDEDVRTALEDQDGLKAQMSPAVRAALGNPANFFPDQEVIEAETIRVEAVDAIREILRRPKWQGLTVQEGDELDDLVSRITADVQRYKAQAVRENDDPDRVTFRSTVEWLLNRGSITDLDAENAIAISSGIAIRDQERIDLALERRDVLLQAFPDFLGSVLPPEVERRELTGEEIEQLQPAGVR